MTDFQGPRPDVLAERIENLSSRVASLDGRIDKLATKDELIQFMASRDDLVNSQMTDLRDDIKNLTAALERERSERQAAIDKEVTARKEADKENEERTNRARTFALSAIGLVITVVLGLIALINEIGGAPT